MDSPGSPGHRSGPRAPRRTAPGAAVRAALAMALPLVAGLAAGRPEYGALASLGALFAVLGATTPTLRARLRTVAGCLLLGGGGAALGTLVAGHGWVAFAVLTALALLSGVISALGRAASLCGLMLLLNAVLAAGLPSAGPWWVPPVLVAGGGLLVFGLCLAGRAPRDRLRAARRPPGTAVRASPSDARHPAASPWRSARAYLSSAGPWSYGLRLALCVGTAEALVVLMPFERAYWVPVTVVFVLKPDFGPVLDRALLRAAGTAAGLLAAVAVFAWVPRGWWEVPVMVLLGAAVPPLAVRGYGFQTAAVTPVVLVLSDLANLEGTELAGQLMSDTLIGCAVTLAAGYALRPAVWRAVGRSVRHPVGGRGRLPHDRLVHLHDPAGELRAAPLGRAAREGAVSEVP
ncbi:FUSC family protein [Streptomyces wuyuanensis]|uniref:FUSC family protein n=1 Tax=Streptomyces wuyuanensis TaxID=1196353 RepID=UPI0034167877